MDDDVPSVFRWIGEQERAERAAAKASVPDEYNQRRVSDILAEMGEPVDAVRVVKAIDARIVRLIGAALMPVIAGFIKELKADNAALKESVDALERRLNTDTRPSASAQQPATTTWPPTNVRKTG